MTKLSRRPINSEKLGHYINNLWSAFTLMGSKEDIKLLFRSLFTHTEYKMFAKRLEIARRLLNHDTYESIMNDLNVSDKTISHVSNILIEKGAGFIKANEKLLNLERNIAKKINERQNYLERRVRPKVFGETVLPNLVKVGVKQVEKSIRKTIKYKSANETLMP